MGPVDPSARDGVSLTAMRWWHIDAATELERHLFAEDSPWTPAMFWAELAAGHSYLAAVDDQGRLRGYAGLSIGPDAAEVHTMAVSPACRRRGIGRMLLQGLLDRADTLQVYLEVRTDNAPAIALYEAHAFERIGLRRGYYRPSGADAYTMVRPAILER